MSVTIEVQLPDDLIPLLDQRARGAGLDREQYVRSIVSRDLVGPRRLDDILGAFRHQVSESGHSDQELFDLFAAGNHGETKTDCCDWEWSHSPFEFASCSIARTFSQGPRNSPAGVLGFRRDRPGLSLNKKSSFINSLKNFPAIPSVQLK